MKLIDMHCDTMNKIFYRGGSLFDGNFKVNIEKLIEGNYGGQFFATFFYLNKVNSPFEAASEMIDMFYLEANKYEEYLKITGSYDLFNRNLENNCVSAFITIEEGGALEGKLENLDYFYNKGVRLIGLTWNFENTLGFPHLINEPLKRFGKEAVEKMHDMGIIVDVSHLSDKGFEDVYNISKSYNKPFIASHSNSRVLTNHSRNLTDDMIRKIGESGGLIGLNFAADFLGTSKISTTEDIVKHMKHIKNKGGIDCLAFGSDFDGIDNEVEIVDAAAMKNLQEILIEKGFTQSETDKIMFKNPERIIKEVIK
ncbi:MAG: membrane dipeptidase [Clostridium sp.]